MSDDLMQMIAQWRSVIEGVGDGEVRLSTVNVGKMRRLLDAAEAGMRAREEIEALKHDIARHIAAVAAERDAALEEAAKVADQLVFDEVALTGTNDSTKVLRLVASRIRALKVKP